GREDLRVAAKVGSDQRRPDARRVGRLPPSLRKPRLRRGPGGLHTRHQGVRQAPGRALPLGLQQTLPRRADHLRRQQPARQPLGREDLQRRPQGGQGPPARRPRAGPRLDPRDLALLARRCPLQPRQTRRRSSAQRVRCCLRLTQGVSWLFLLGQSWGPSPGGPSPSPPRAAPMGTANATPANAWSSPGSAIATTMPMTRPAASRRGPPELPGLTEASNWMRPLRPPLSVVRSRPDTTPVETL